jgi:hypothetical protein
MDKSYIVIGMQANTVDYTGYSLSKNNIYGFEAEQLSNQYVIVYSVLVHEQEEVVLDLVKNIFYFNKSIPCCIVLHCSVDLYSKIADKFKGIKHLYINPKPVNKKWSTYSLFEAHLDNYSYMSHVDKVSFKYFILLASNCLFHKDFTIDILKKENDAIYDDYRMSESLLYTSIKNIQFSPVKVKVLLENNNFCNVFKYNGIKIVVSQVEGAIIDKETMEYIYQFVKYYKLKDNITTDTYAFEELIFPTLYMAKNKKMMPHMCKVYWRQDTQTLLNYIYKYFSIESSENHVPTLDELNTANESCVKNIPRNMDNNLRVYIRTKASNYRNLPNFSSTTL